jgi:hypothetical protein
MVGRSETMRPHQPLGGARAYCSAGLTSSRKPQDGQRMAGSASDITETGDPHKRQGT